MNRQVEEELLPPHPRLHYTEVREACLKLGLIADTEELPDIVGL